MFVLTLITVTLLSNYLVLIRLCDFNFKTVILRYPRRVYELYIGTNKHTNFKANVKLLLIKKITLLFITLISLILLL